MGAHGNISFIKNMAKTMQCPHCGNYVEGIPQRDFKRKVTRGAIKKGSTMATGAAIGSIVPGIGTLIICDSHVQNVVMNGLSKMKRMTPQITQNNHDPRGS